MGATFILLVRDGQEGTPRGRLIGSNDDVLYSTECTPARGLPERAMPSWLSEVLKLLGLSTPFVYAAAVYGFFHYLDAKASEPAKTAISGWLQPRGHNKTAVADAMIEIFDRLYTRPLLGWRAFMRSALFTICMTVVFLYEFGLLSRGDKIENQLIALMREAGHFWALLIFTQSVLANVVCDYVALFIVRRFLVMGRLRPMIASLLAPVAGISIVYAVFYGLGKWVFSYEITQMFVGDSLKEMIIESVKKEEFLENPVVKDLVMKVYNTGILVTRLQRVLMPAAFVVHMWLPLLGLCVLLLRGLNYFRLAVGRTQWFLKSGREHPLDAIGYVGACIAFVATIVIQHIAGAQ
jgi:hypothetical protein